jgi:cell division protein FtsZ
LEFEKSRSEVNNLLSDGTKMVFIAAGMGGGTGSGAGPILAKMAKEKGLLTVGIVTIPFLFERIPRIIQALDAVEAMSENVDALIVINNERLKEYYPDFDLDEAFKKPNEVLSMAVKSIAEIITVKGVINRDFNDVTTTMKNGGVALVSYGFGAGDTRLDDAIQEALDSPLLNNSDIYNARRVLFYISLQKNSHFKVDELTKSIDNFMGRFDPRIKMNWGYGTDESLEHGQEVKFTLIATGFGLDVVPDLKQRRDEAVIQDLHDQDKKHKEDLDRVNVAYNIDNIEPLTKINRVKSSQIVVLTMDEMDDDKLIDLLENNPPYCRNKKEMKEIDDKRKSTKTAENNEIAEFIVETGQTSRGTFFIDMLQ